jgi:hypothetical protein
VSRSSKRQVPGFVVPDASGISILGQPSL